MAVFVFKLPDVGEGTAEAEIVAWHVALGDRVEEDAPLVDVMTDKATVEMTSPVSGIVRRLNGIPGELAAVGAALVEFEIESEIEPAAETTAQPSEAAPTPAPELAPTPALGPAFGAQAAPAVRRRAEQLGLALASLTGSGPDGRVEHADLDAALVAARPGSSTAAPPSQGAPRTGVTEIKIIGLRRKIAEKMQDAKRRIPHFAYVEEIDMSELEALRGHLNHRHAERGKLTVLPFFVRALCQALPQFPQINAIFDDEAGIVRRHAAVHVGIATQTDAGLMVPVLRHAEARDLWDVSAEIARLSRAARDNRATRDELTGSTITVTSLGALGGVATTPVINHPEVAIIGPNRIVERPVVRQGQIVVRRMMNLSSSFDHRVVDGYDAAQFVQVLKGLLEHPAALWID